MGVRADTASGLPDGLKWAGVGALVAAGIGGFYYWGEHSLLLRVIGLLLIAAAAVFVSLQTERGRVMWEFVRESRTEVRKVVWPNRRETLQTTGIVIAMVAVVAVFLWMLDGALGWAVRLLLGGGG